MTCSSGGFISCNPVKATFITPVNSVSDGVPWVVLSSLLQSCSVIMRRKGKHLLNTGSNGVLVWREEFWNLLMLYISVKWRVLFTETVISKCSNNSFLDSFWYWQKIREDLHKLAHTVVTMDVVWNFWRQIQNWEIWEEMLFTCLPVVTEFQRDKRVSANRLEMASTRQYPLLPTKTG